MTPEDRVLDTDFFHSDHSIIVFRLARARYANLSGLGAANAPGRWNRQYQEAIYTSTEKGIPVLERLVHTPKDMIPSNLAFMEIHISGQWEIDKNVWTDPRANSCIWFCPSIAAARGFFSRDSLFRDIDPFAVAVPSVIVPVWNMVLYPQARGFWNHVSVRTIEPFEFDSRLFPEETAREPLKGASAS